MEGCRQPHAILPGGDTCYSIVSFGSVGVGKSTFCNFLIDGTDQCIPQKFKASADSVGGVTRVVSSFRANALGSAEGKYIHVFDIPGLTDPSMPIYEWTEEVSSKLQGQQLDMAVLVIKCTDFRTDVSQLISLTAIQKGLSNLNPKNVFLCVTHCDAKPRGLSLSEWHTRLNLIVAGKLESFKSHGLEIQQSNVIQFDCTTDSLEPFAESFVKGNMQLGAMKTAMKNVGDILETLLSVKEDPESQLLLQELKFLRDIIQEKGFIGKKQCMGQENAHKVIPLETKSHCMGCNKNFGWFTWKHNCKQCGCVICYQCSTKKKSIQGYGEKLVRVCKVCTDVVQKITSAGIQFFTKTTTQVDCSYWKRCFQYLLENLDFSRLEDSGHDCFCEECCTKNGIDKFIVSDGSKRLYDLPIGFAVFNIKQEQQRPSFQNGLKGYHGTKLTSYNSISRSGMKLLKPGMKHVDGGTIQERKHRKVLTERSYPQVSSQAPVEVDANVIYFKKSESDRNDSKKVESYPSQAPYSLEGGLDGEEVKQQPQEGPPNYPNIFASPCICYAGSAYYANPKIDKQNSKKYQVVLGVSIDSALSVVIGAETIGAKGKFNICNHGQSNNELEYEIDNEDNVMITMVLLREK